MFPNYIDDILTDHVFNETVQSYKKWLREDIMQKYLGDVFIGNFRAMVCGGFFYSYMSEYSVKHPNTDIDLYFKDAYTAELARDYFESVFKFEKVDDWLGSSVLSNKYIAEDYAFNLIYDEKCCGDGVHNVISNFDYGHCANGYSSEYDKFFISALGANAVFHKKLIVNNKQKLLAQYQKVKDFRFAKFTIKKGMEPLFDRKRYGINENDGYLKELVGLMQVMQKEYLQQYKKDILYDVSTHGAMLSLKTDTIVYKIYGYKNYIRKNIQPLFDNAFIFTFQRKICGAAFYNYCVYKNLHNTNTDIDVFFKDKVCYDAAIEYLKRGATSGWEETSRTKSTRTSSLWYNKNNTNFTFNLIDNYFGHTVKEVVEMFDYAHCVNGIDLNTYIFLISPLCANAIENHHLVINNIDNFKNRSKLWISNRYHKMTYIKALKPTFEKRIILP